MTSTPENGQSPADQLRAAKALIDAPERWTQGDFSNEYNGIRCFCALGALGEEDEDVLEHPEAVAFLRHALPQDWLRTSKYGAMDNGSPIAEFNDSCRTTHADIMALFDRAIALASTGGQDRG